MEKDGMLRVEVKDNGPGIPDDSGESIFQPFVTTREGHPGLGLAIARRVMFELGGRVGVVDSQGGATFFLEFPTPPGSDAGRRSSVPGTSER
jgi:signal transduction histidine kinase